MMTVRGAVKIPVVGTGMATHTLACQLARRHAVISLNRDLNPGIIRAIKAAGCYNRVTSIRSIARPFKFPSKAFPYSPEELEEEVTKIAIKQIEKEEAQLLIISMSIIFLVLPPGAQARLTEKLGIIVIDPMNIAIKTAEMLVRLGLLHSKIEYPQIEF